ncbi:MOC2B synthase, partial [Ciccaba nigrolineata]|nr:MOC2B synthase [Ciccaba nigrolineata]
MDESEDVPKDFIKLKSEKLSIDEVSELVISPCCGAVSLFIGTTRNNFEGKKVIHLEYEAYMSMAETEIKKICRDVRQKWPSVKHIAVHHRLGNCLFKNVCIGSVCWSPHLACRILDAGVMTLTIFPILCLYLQEIYEGEYSWKENKECFWTNSEK